ncbi:unnamed protein product [Arabis nemorensis]|uniref:Uncharacterized protein n=1 Tax=Arabis nemorensis TaxID=586526 RepID=A0A565CCV2_9BRAS|nr:unnamed protein product [Arabis nemorensis]
MPQNRNDDTHQNEEVYCINLDDDTHPSNEFTRDAARNSVGRGGQRDMRMNNSNCSGKRGISTHIFGRTLGTSGEVVREKLEEDNRRSGSRSWFQVDQTRVIKMWSGMTLVLSRIDGTTIQNFNVTKIYDPSK